LAPISGSAAGSGEQLKNAVDLAFDAVDYVVADTNIEFILVDSFSDASGEGTAVANYQKAIDAFDPVMGFLNWHSGVSVDCMDVAAAEKLPHPFAFGATNVVNQKYLADPAKYKYWPAKGWPMPGTYVKAYTDMFENIIRKSRGETVDINLDENWTPGAQKILLAQEAGAWGDSFVAGARAIIEESTGFWKTDGTGWTISDEINIDDENLFASQLAAAKADDVSLILATSTNENVALFTQSLGTELPNAITVIEGLSWGPGLERAGATAEGILEGGYRPFPDTTATNAFRASFKQKYGVEASSSSSGLAYDYSQLLIKMLERAVAKHGAIDRAAVIDIMDTELMTGTLTLTAAQGAVVMDEYKWTAASAPDPVYDVDHYYFPVAQYQMDGAAPSAAIVFPASVAGTNEFDVPPYGN
jgi:branched-chain amino acid transport system substrate-binding protein